MSLDWNAQSVERIDERLKDENDNVSIANFCWALMAIGIGKVTKENANEVFLRIQIWEALHGPVTYRYDEQTKTKSSIYGNLDYVRSMIGYRTNVSDETMLNWTKRITKNRLADLAAERV